MKDDNVIKMSELKARKHEELLAMVEDARGEERKATFKQALGQLPKTHVLRQIRRNIARLKTELNGRGRAVATEGQDLP